MQESAVNRLIMENLPLSQDRVELDVLANDVFLDAKTIGKDLDMHSVYGAIKLLHEKQDLFIFSDGTVAATQKGLKQYG